MGSPGGGHTQGCSAPPPHPVISKAPRGFPLPTSERKRCPGPGASGGGTGRPRALGRHGVSLGCHGAPRGAQGVTEQPPSLWSLRCHRLSPRCHGAASGPAGSVVSSLPHRNPRFPLGPPPFPIGVTPISPGDHPIPQGAPPLSPQGHPFPIGVTPFPNGDTHSLLPPPTPPPILTPFPFCVPPQARWRCPPDPCGATRKASAESSSAVTWR